MRSPTLKFPAFSKACTSSPLGPLLVKNTTTALLTSDGIGATQLELETAVAAEILHLGALGAIGLVGGRAGRGSGAGGGNLVGLAGHVVVI